MPALLGGLGVIVGIVLLLAVNQKWARIDPHNVAEGPSWLGASIRALMIVAILTVGLYLNNIGRPDWAGLIGSMAISMAFGPSISSPVIFRRDEVSDPIKRRLAGLPEVLGGALMKTVVVAVVSYLVSWLVPHQTTIWVTGVLALLLGVMKAPVVILLLRDKPQEVRRKLIGGNVILTCLLGTVALALFVLVAVSLAAAIPSISHVDYRTLVNLPAIVGFFLGLAIAYR